MNGPVSAHLLICDDEPDVRDMLSEYFTQRGFRVTAAANADAARSAIAAASIDAMVLDINMPGEDGLTLLRGLRSENDCPVIMLTAIADVVDRIVGLELGADDYLAKPVDLRELEARVKTVLRRHKPPQSQWQPQSQPDGSATDDPASCAPGRIRFGPCALDLEGARLFDSTGQDVPITAMEFRLLKVFAENRGRVLNRDQLLEQAHDRSWDPFDRSIDIRISRLRRKIEPNPSKPEIIRTVRGLGYIFT